MPLYESKLPHEEMQKVIDKGCVCLECGALLTIAWGGFYGHNEFMLRCGNDAKHEGIARDASLSPYDIPGFNLFNLSKGRKKRMTQELGAVKTKALDKYMGVVSLTQPQAKEILKAVFPKAPESEIARAMILCANYGLNPLMKHVFLIPFNEGKSNESWVTVIGIKAKRLLASRRGPYSYIDDTPRVMTDTEQKKIFGKVEPDKLWVITKGRDPATGAEAVGYGFWPNDKQPLGTDKGNTAFNMASIRSESQMTDRLRPGEMPEGIDVIPEEMAEGSINAEYRVLNEEPSEKVEPEKEHWCEKHDCQYDRKVRGSAVWYAHKAEGGWCNEKDKKAAKPEASASIVSPEATSKDEPPPPKPARDLGTILTINDLFKACNTDFKLQPDQVIKELGVSSQSDISDTPADCYSKIAAVR